MGKIYEITNEIERHITEDPAIKNRFTKHIDRFCKMVEDYGQVLQPYEQQLKDAEERLTQDKTPKPPKGWVKMNYWDNPFINIDMGVIYRPTEPVNPLLWLGLFGRAGIQRKPNENEKLMCAYVLLTIIHDYNLRFSGTPTDTPILSADYKGKLFRRDEFFEKVWFNYYQANQDKLSQLERAFNLVQADLARTKQVEIKQDATPAISIQNSNVILGDVHQPENLQVGDNARIYKQEKTEEKKKGILSRIPYWIYLLVSFLAALFACIHYWPEIHQKLQSLFSH